MTFCLILSVLQFRGRYFRVLFLMDVLKEPVPFC
jgi:hypothetical protein